MSKDIISRESESFIKDEAVPAYFPSLSLRQDLGITRNGRLRVEIAY